MVDVLRVMHEWSSWAMIVVCGVAGTWTVAAHVRTSLDVAAMWSMLNVGYATVFVVTATGGLVVAISDVEADGTHMFYGFLTFAAVGVIVAYRHLAQYRYLLHGLGSLFIMGLGIRGLFLDPVLPS